MSTLSSLLNRPIPEETLNKARLYMTLLEKWNASINLVAKSTVANAWERHFLDSAALVPLIENERTLTIVDFGSGAGFPALVIALLTNHTVHLIESDSKKCAFLQHVAQETGVSVHIHNTRIEKTPCIQADVITARACAPLEKLLEYAVPFSTKETTCLFLKGAEVESEIETAKKQWTATVLERIKNPVSASFIIKIKGWQRVGN
jgi:16S rRNA (guanine527-N7)-methyltransferase